MFVNICECLWISVNVCECLWMSVNVCEYLWIFVNICECLWMFVNICECLWIFVNICEWLWIFVNICEYLWMFVDVCEYLWIFVPLYAQLIECLASNCCASVEHLAKQAHNYTHLTVTNVLHTLTWLASTSSRSILTAHVAHLAICNFQNVT
jgi:hypothetical protein